MESAAIAIETTQGPQLANGVAKKEKKPHTEAKAKVGAVAETTGTASVRIEVSKALLEKFTEYEKARGPISAEELEEKAKAKGSAAFEKTLNEAMSGDEPFQKYLAKKNR